MFESKFDIPVVFLAFGEVDHSLNMFFVWTIAVNLSAYWATILILRTSIFRQAFDPGVRSFVFHGCRGFSGILDTNPARDASMNKVPVAAWNISLVWAISGMCAAIYLFTALTHKT